MREVNAMPGLEIHLGRVGENMAVCVVLDVTDWRQTYGDGSVQLLHKRNGDQYPYPCAIEVDGGRVCWPVTASDVAVAGKGWAELQYLVGEVCVKSETFATRVERALGNAGPTPPEPHEGWVQQVLEAGAQVEASAEEAADAAARAQEHAESVAELKEVAVQAHEAAVEALEALEGIDEAQQAVAADRAAIEAMTVTSETLEPGEDATVEKIKQDGVMTLHFGIPTGDSGVYVGTTKPTDPNVRVWINPNGKANDNPGGGGGSGADGEDGGYYTPAVNNGVLTWEASKDDMPAVPSANIMGPAGADGKPGDPGKDGAQGPAGPAGADGLTPHIGANGNWWLGDEDTGVSAGGSGGGSTGGGASETLVVDFTVAEDATQVNLPVADMAATFGNAREIVFELSLQMPSADSATKYGNLSLGFWYSWGVGDKFINNLACLPTNSAAYVKNVQVFGAARITKSIVRPPLYPPIYATAVTRFQNADHENKLHTFVAARALWDNASMYGFALVGSHVIGAGSTIKIYARE